VIETNNSKKKRTNVKLIHFWSLEIKQIAEDYVIVIKTSNMYASLQLKI